VAAEEQVRTDNADVPGRDLRDADKGLAHFL
jgi:hypothetical protein